MKDSIYIFLISIPLLSISIYGFNVNASEYSLKYQKIEVNKEVKNYVKSCRTYLKSTSTAAPKYINTFCKCTAFRLLAKYKTTNHISDTEINTRCNRVAKAKFLQKNKK